MVVIRLILPLQNKNYECVVDSHITVGKWTEYIRETFFSEENELQEDYEKKALLFHREGEQVLKEEKCLMDYGITDGDSCILI